VCRRLNMESASQYRDTGRVHGWSKTEEGEADGHDQIQQSGEQSGLFLAARCVAWNQACSQPGTLGNCEQQQTGWMFMNYLGSFNMMNVNVHESGLQWRLLCRLWLQRAQRHALFRRLAPAEPRCDEYIGRRCVEHSPAPTRVRWQMHVGLHTRFNSSSTLDHGRHQAHAWSGRKRSWARR
jgi:hypothetical protein